MLTPFKPEIEKLKSTKDTMDLAQRIYKVLKDEPELPELLTASMMKIATAYQSQNRQVKALV